MIKQPRSTWQLGSRLVDRLYWYLRICGARISSHTQVQSQHQTQNDQSKCKLRIKVGTNCHPTAILSNWSASQHLLPDTQQEDSRSLQSRTSMASKRAASKASKAASQPRVRQQVTSPWRRRLTPTWISPGSPRTKECNAQVRHKRKEAPSCAREQPDIANPHHAKSSLTMRWLLWPTAVTVLWQRTDSWLPSKVSVPLQATPRTLQGRIPGT